MKLSDQVNVWLQERADQAGNIAVPYVVLNTWFSMARHLEEMAAVNAEQPQRTDAATLCNIIAGILVRVALDGGDADEVREVLVAGIRFAMRRINRQGSTLIAPDGRLTDLREALDWLSDLNETSSEEAS